MANSEVNQETVTRVLHQRKDETKENTNISKPTLDDPLQKEQEYKLFNDPIHGCIEVHKPALLIVNSPQFQRLRNIKQLGTLHYVYPGANGTRFDHSLGVYHLAGKVVKFLKEHQPELNISEEDCLCVELAGLCHDLGHGPFSNFFEKLLVPALNGRRWKHTETSLQILDLIYKQTNISDMISEKDWKFVKSLIAADKKCAGTGRDESKAFLYEIVQNDENGMDVDKWDYLLRDAHYLGMKQNVEYERFMHSMKVKSVNGEMHIGIRDKMFDSVFNMYLSRYRQHKHAYQHPVGVAVDLMVLDAFVKAQDFLKVNGKTLIESLDDAEAFCQLDDSAYYKILHSNPNESSDHGNDLLEAKKIIKRIESRRLYKCIAQHTQKGSALLLTGLEDLLRGVSPIGSFKLHQGARDLGLNTDNPLKHMTFYKKDGSVVREEDEFEGKSLIIPEHFMDYTVYLYITDPELPEEQTRSLKEEFKKYFNGGRS